jgi:glycosyltransferase involved in cell wall biosynthesis
MRLAINLRPYVEGEIGGMGNYVRHVIGGIATDHRVRAGLTVFALNSQLEHVRKFAPDANLIGVTNETVVAIILAELERAPYDLLFCPLLVLDPPRVNIPSAVTIPDLQHEYYPEFFDSDTLKWRKETFQPSAFYADNVFTISEYSKSTIVDRFGICPDKVVVVGLDVDPEFRLSPTAEAQRAFRELQLSDYIYFPANFWKHKNHSTLLRALRHLIDHGHTGLNLVLTGAPSTGMERVKVEVAKLKLTRNVRFLGYQPRPVIAELYRHSLCLAFVSLFEGFGIPILEAFHTQTPVVTSRGTSCSEVAGDAAVFVNERDPEDVAAGLRRIIEDRHLRAELTTKGKSRAEQYSWRKAVDSTLRTFETVIARGGGTRIEVREHPLVSIVTPTFNMGHLLEETIQSVLSQDYPNVEYIVMDGGSKDSTLGVLRKYEGRLQYRSEPDQGQAHAINKGFGLTKGEIFAFLNADDTYLPGAVSTAVTSLMTHRNVGVVYGDAYHVHEDGSIMAAYPTRPYDYNLLSRNCFICQPAAFMWRNAFVEAGWMNQDLQFALDYDLWIRIAKMRPLMKIEGYLATSRMYRENKTVSKRRQVYEEIIRVVGTHYGFVPYDWIYGFAAYLVDGKDQIFEVSRPSMSKQLFALALGSAVNRRHLVRFWNEWRTRTGLGQKFTGRWDDGWMSKCYAVDLSAETDCEQIVVAGRHFAPLPKGLTLSLRLNGDLLEKKTLRDTGPFQFAVKCPPDARGRSNRLTLESNRVFRPAKDGDYRPLSCLIDSITTERSGAR